MTDTPHEAPTVDRALSDVANVSVYAQLDDDDQRQVMIAGLTPEPIRLNPDNALRLGVSLQKLSGKVPQKDRQEPSDSTKSIANTARLILDANRTVSWDPAGRAPTSTVLRLLVAGWAGHGYNWLPSQQAFGRAMRLLGLEPIKSHGERFYTGITVTPDEDYLPPIPTSDGGQQGADRTNE